MKAAIRRIASNADRVLPHIASWKRFESQEEPFSMIFKTFDEWFFDYKIKHGLKHPVKNIAADAWQAALPRLNHFVEDEVVLGLVNAVKPFLQIEEHAAYSLGQVTAADIKALKKAHDICAGQLQ